MRLSQPSILVVSIVTIFAWLIGTLLLACSNDFSCGTSEKSPTPITQSPEPTAPLDQCPVYLSHTISPRIKNDRNEVTRLQIFLNSYMNLSLKIDGTYDRDDIQALMQFQAMHGDEILAPYNLRSATGIVSETTRGVINRIQCDLITQNTTDGQTVPTPASGNKPGSPMQFPLGLTIALFAAALSGSLVTLLALSNRTHLEREPLYPPIPPMPTLAPIIPLSTEAIQPVTTVEDSNLVIIEGIGPKIAELLKSNGIDSLKHLSKMSPKALQVILKKAGPRFEMHSPIFWPEQARLLSEKKFAEFEKLKSALRSGKLK